MARKLRSCATLFYRCNSNAFMYSNRPIHLNLKQKLYMVQLVFESICILAIEALRERRVCQTLKFSAFPSEIESGSSSVCRTIVPLLASI